MVKENSMTEAFEISLSAHRGQRDKGGEAYVAHPVRVMKQVENHKTKIVALLHDVIEDSQYQAKDLHCDFSDDVVSAVECLTKNSDQSYPEYIEKISENEIARKVKIADLRDNLDLERLEELNEDDFQRIQKYHKSLQTLKKQMNIR